MQSVAAKLEGAGLGEYVQGFEDAGYDTLQDFDLNGAELRQMASECGMNKPGHIKRFVKLFSDATDGGASALSGSDATEIKGAGVTDGGAGGSSAAECNISDPIATPATVEPPQAIKSTQAVKTTGAIAPALLTMFEKTINDGDVAALTQLVQGGAGGGYIEPLLYACASSSKGAAGAIAVLLGGKPNLEQLGKHRQYKFELTPLYAAVTSAQKAPHIVAHIRQLLTAGASPTTCIIAPSGSSISPMYFVCMKGHHEVLALLLSAKADVSAMMTEADGTQHPPLYTACIHGHIECMRLLIKAGAPLDGLKRRGDELSLSALHPACEEGKHEIVKLLLDAKADSSVPMKSDSGMLRPPLLFACVNERIDCIKLLIKARAPVDQPKTKPNGWSATSLFLACEVGKDEVVRLLLDAGADAGLPWKNEDGWLTPPLYTACYKGHVEIVKLLLKARAPVNVPKTKPSGWLVTPLYLMCEEGKDAIVKLLLDAKADSSMAFKNDSGDTSPSLWKACSLGHLECATLLIKAKASLDEPKKEASGAEWPPLYHAASFGKDDVLKLLIDSKADTSVSGINAGGDVIPPLGMACFKGHVLCAKHLLAGRASADQCYLTSKFEVPPLKYALLKEQAECVELLLNARVSPEQRGYVYGCEIRPLVTACASGSVKCATMLLNARADINALTGTFPNPSFPEQNSNDLPPHGPMTALIAAAVGTTKARADGQLAGQQACIELLLERGADVAPLCAWGKDDSTERGVYEHAKHSGHSPACLKLLEPRARVMATRECSGPLQGALFGYTEYELMMELPVSNSRRQQRRVWARYSKLRDLHDQLMPGTPFPITKAFAHSIFIAQRGSIAEGRQPQICEYLNMADATSPALLRFFGCSEAEFPTAKKPEGDGASYASYASSATSPSSRSAARFATDEAKARVTKAAEVDQYVSTALTGLDKLLQVGSALPMIGNVCSVAREIVGHVEAYHQKAQDLLQAGERVLDVLELLEMMSQNVERLKHDQAPQVERRMASLCSRLIEFRDAVNGYGETGYLMRTFKVARSASSLESIDRKLAEQLKLLQSMYQLAQDTHVHKLLTSRKYALEAAVAEQLKARIEETGESREDAITALTNDPEAVAEAAAKGGVSEQVFMSEIGEFRDEVREHFAGVGVKLDDIMRKLELLAGENSSRF